MSRPPNRRTADSAARFAARARRRRWAALRPLLVLGVLLALAGTLVWVVLGTGVLGVRRVTVTGTHRLSRAAVLAAADVPRHHPLATLDLGSIHDRVARLAAVASVRVVRQWPSTVQLRVVERAPVASVEAAGGWRLVDRTGVPFWPVPAAVRGLPVLRVSTPGPGDPATGAALAVLRSLPASIRHRVAEVDAPSPASVRLKLRDGRTVVWGTAADGRRKAAVLAALLHRPGHVYDVSTPDVATVR